MDFISRASERIREWLTVFPKIYNVIQVLDVGPAAPAQINPDDHIRTDVLTDFKFNKLIQLPGQQVIKLMNTIEAIRNRDIEVVFAFTALKHCPYLICQGLKECKRNMCLLKVSAEAADQFIAANDEIDDTDGHIKGFLTSLAPEDVRTWAVPAGRVCFPGAPVYLLRGREDIITLLIPRVSHLLAQASYVSSLAAVMANALTGAEKVIKTTATGDIPNTLVALYSYCSGFDSSNDRRALKEFGVPYKELRKAKVVVPEDQKDTVRSQAFYLRLVALCKFLVDALHMGPVSFSESFYLELQKKAECVLCEDIVIEEECDLIGYCVLRVIMLEYNLHPMGIDISAGHPSLSIKASRFFRELRCRMPSFGDVAINGSFTSIKSVLACSSGHRFSRAIVLDSVFYEEDVGRLHCTVSKTVADDAGKINARGDIVYRLFDDRGKAFADYVTSYEDLPPINGRRLLVHYQEGCKVEYPSAIERISQQLLLDSTYYTTETTTYMRKLTQDDMATTRDDLNVGRSRPFPVSTP